MAEVEAEIVGNGLRIAEDDIFPQFFA